MVRQIGRIRLFSVPATFGANGARFSGLRGGERNGALIQVGVPNLPAGSRFVCVPGFPKFPACGYPGLPVCGCPEFPENSPKFPESRAELVAVPEFVPRIAAEFVGVPEFPGIPGRISLPAFCGCPGIIFVGVRESSRNYPGIPPSRWPRWQQVGALDSPGECRKITFVVRSVGLSMTCPVE
jgi:hypothetical protein